MDLVTETINSRFYWDDNEKLLLFTTPDRSDDDNPGSAGIYCEDMEWQQ